MKTNFRRRSLFAIFSFIFGVIGLGLFYISIVVMILGVIALVLIVRNKKIIRGRGYAITGIVLGICGILGRLFFYMYNPSRFTYSNQIYRNC